MGELIDELDRRDIVVAITVVIVLILSYFFVIAKPDESSLRMFFMSAIPSTIPVLLAFIVGYALFRRSQRVKSEREAEVLASRVVTDLQASLSNQITMGLSTPDSTFYEEFRKVPWEELFPTSVRLDICVHYFDTWFTQYPDPLQQLLNRGGKIRIILPNYKNELLVKTVKQRFPEQTEEEVQGKIKSTEAKFFALLEKATHKEARVETYYVDEMLLYCAVRFDQRILILSIYEHAREMRVGAPAVMIYLPNFHVTQTWFDKEFSGLMSKAVNRRLTSRRSKKLKPSKEKRDG